MKQEGNFNGRRVLLAGGTVLTVTLVLFFLVALAVGAPGDTVQTPVQPIELPIEIETELATGSLKQAPLWKETVQLLENPYGPDLTPGTPDDGTIVRRDGFGIVMPALNVYPLNFNPNLGQPLRLRPSDGEISWDQPGPLFDPDEEVAVDAFNVPTELRTIIGQIVASNDDVLDAGEANNTAPCLDPFGPAPVGTDTCGFLIVSNPGADPRIPEDGTVVAVPATIDGELVDETGAAVEVPLETPINEIDFLRDVADTAGVDPDLQPFIGRLGAETLGKALFWDMQVGSDGIQACGTCHFAGGIDTRVVNQLNPDSEAGQISLQMVAPNQGVRASDFPSHKLTNLNEPGEALLNPVNAVVDADDSMSSMGVVFRTFVDIPPIGGIDDPLTPIVEGSFQPAQAGVSALRPDLGIANPDPIPNSFLGFRRVEPRNTPTFHSAAFNLDNFWDGRAKQNFNGGSVFGATDPFSHVFRDDGGSLVGATNGDFRPDLLIEDPVAAAQPVRIKFSSLGSQAVGPPLSNFEMSFDGRNWPKIGKKLLQTGVTPLANQLVATDDSRLGSFSNQGGSACADLGRTTAAGMPGLCVSYDELISIAFTPDLVANSGSHLNGAPNPADGFDLFSLTPAAGAADPASTVQFTQAEANFSLFFGLSVQTYEQLTIPDDTPFDQFMDANPLAANAIAQPGEQGTLPPEAIPGLVGPLTLVPGFGEEEIFGFDFFAGANLTAALPEGSVRNPDGFGSNPFLRSTRCMICHLGPEQSDATNSIGQGLLLSNTEFEFPTPQTAPEPTGPFMAIGGTILAEEVNEVSQDAIEIEPRDMQMFDNPATAFDDRVISQPGHFGFGDQGIYNIGVRPSAEDLGRGGLDPFGMPKSNSALAMMNLAGTTYIPCDDPADAAIHPTGCAMTTADPALDFGSGLFEETGEGALFPGSAFDLQSINPGLSMTPINPLLPVYIAPFANNLPAGELHPQVDELSQVPNTISEPNGGPALEFGENLYGSDVHCGAFDPATFGAGPPNFGWGPTIPGDPGSCANSQSGVPNNFDPDLQGTWPFPNRVTRNGAFKAPPLRNAEMTGPYFHNGSQITLRQVVDFYMRAGDFPLTNAEHRDAHIIDVDMQAFAFGATTDIPPEFQDAIPDTISQYDALPDTDHATTPEPATSTPEAVKSALVSFLLSLTDNRVKMEQAPFDRPEIFVPMDGTAPDNTGGRTALLADTRFQHLDAVGSGGRVDPLPNPMGISSTPLPGPNNDHFDSQIEPERYFWTWYDSVSMKNWVLAGNPAGAAGNLETRLHIAGDPQIMPNEGILTASDVAPTIHFGLLTGPVRLLSNTGEKAVTSQRSLMGNSFEEVLGTDADRMSDHYYWPWYDMVSPGFKNWVLVANPSLYETIRVTLSFTNVTTGLPFSMESPDILPGANWLPTFPGMMGGPVELKSYITGGTWDNLADRRDSVASQRVLSNSDTAFNEVPGIPAEELSSSYLWTWYDMASLGFADWVLIANPSAVDPVTYEIKIAGITRATGSIPAGGTVTPQFPGIIGGPVEVIASGNVIAAQRSIAGPSFEEVPGYSAGTQSATYHWTWYDMTSGFTNWVLIANTSPATVTYDIMIDGVIVNSGSIPAGGNVTPTFPGQIGGPVQVTASAPVMASQRVMFNGHFNEVLGTVLP